MTSSYLFLSQRAVHELMNLFLPRAWEATNANIPFLLVWAPLRGISTSPCHHAQQHPVLVVACWAVEAMLCTWGPQEGGELASLEAEQALAGVQQELGLHDSPLLLPLVLAQAALECPPALGSCSGV